MNNYAKNIYKAEIYMNRQINKDELYYEEYENVKLVKHVYLTNHLIHAK